MMYKMKLKWMEKKQVERIMKQEYMSKQDGKLAEIYESIKNRIEKMKRRINEREGSVADEDISYILNIYLCL